MAIIIAGEKTDENSQPAPKQENKKVQEQINEPEKVENRQINIKPEVVKEAVNNTLEERVPMSRLRQAIARRLKEAH